MISVKWMPEPTLKTACPRRLTGRRILKSHTSKDILNNFIMAAKARGSWDSNDKRTKAGRDNRAYHPHKDTDAFLGAIGSLMSGSKKRKTSENKSIPKKSASQINSDEKITELEIKAEIQREEARVREALAEKQVREDALRKVEEERLELINEISNINFDNNRADIIKNLDHLFSVFDSNRSSSIRANVLNKAESGIIKLSAIGADSDVLRYQAKIKRNKQLTLLPIYMIGAGVVIIVVGYLLGTIYKTEMIGNFEMKVRPFRNSKFLIMLVGFSISLFGWYKYSKKVP